MLDSGPNRLLCPLASNMPHLAKSASTMATAMRSHRSHRRSRSSLLATRHHRSGVLWRHFSCPDVIEGINYAHDERRSQIFLSLCLSAPRGHSIFVSTEIIFNSSNSNMELARVQSVDTRCPVDGSRLRLIGPDYKYIS